ncbi:Imm52 family immunity protein [Archangium primigenium]|uniref:Imm52 family immunity protein n=1 Tax=[Archangium] primigenium TaxID=2792470 RepID=UPI00195BF3D5|nr:immunity 52 family protein [Archangium primigenium]
MQEHYYVGSYWGPRQETALECARRAELFFKRLARCDASFAQWYRAGRGFPRDLPGHLIPPEMDALARLFSEKSLRTDGDKTVMEDMGFRLMAWNAKQDATDISLTCGKSSPWGGPNSCLLKPTRASPLRERLLTAPVPADILTSMVTAWDPDFAMASSSEMVEQLETSDFEVRVGWLTYLSRRLGRLPPLPAPVRIEPVGESGWLLVLSSEPLTANNPEHVALCMRVRELLDRAGLIRRPAGP